MAYASLVCLGWIICGIPNPNIPSNPRNTICQTKAPFMRLKVTYSHLLNTPFISCSHKDLPFPFHNYYHYSFLCSSLLFSFLLHYCPALSWQPLLACCHQHHAHKDMPADVLKLCQIQHGGQWL